MGGPLASGILFHLDETLIDRRSSVLEYASILHTKFQSHVSVGKSEFMQLIDQLDGHGRTPRDHFFQDVAERALGGVPPTQVEEDFYQCAWRHPKLFPGVFDALAELKALGFPLGIVTNGSVKSQQPKIENSGLSRKVDAYVISESFGSRKPEASIFLHVARELDVEPASSWHVGDDPVADVLGASDAGFKTIWMRRYLPWPKAKAYSFDAQVSHVYEVLKVVAAVL